MLPLDNLSRNPEQEFFAEGMHEALKAELSNAIRDEPRFKEFLARMNFQPKEVIN